MKNIAAIGIFDGVHLGHKKIISSAVRAARRIGSRSMVITFDPHPAKVIIPSRSVPSIMSTRHRIASICGLGADRVCVIKFDRKFAALSPAGFARDVLVRRYRVSDVYVGGNFVFGKRNSGDCSALKELGERYGFAVHVVPLIKVRGRTVSSSAIRGLIVKGRLDEASKMLGRPVSVAGTVVGGKRRGRLLGYPTANIDPHHEAIPPGGVYAVWVRVKGKRYGGALFIGAPSTFGEKDPVIEVHIFGFRDFIYKEDIEVVFVKRLRASRKFPDHRKLVEQIRRDDIQARKILKLR